MIIKQQISHRAIQKVCHLYNVNGIFHSIQFHLRRPLWVLFYRLSPPLSPSLYYSLKKKLWNEKKQYLLYIRLLKRIRLYQRRYRTVSLDIIAFLDTNLSINNPFWQSSEIIILLSKYSIVIPDTLIGFRPCFSCSSL